MSNTFRRDRNDKIFKESLKKKSFKARYRCQCHYCVGVDKNKIINKIAEKDLKQQIKSLKLNKEFVESVSIVELNNIMKEFDNYE